MKPNHAVSTPCFRLRFVAGLVLALFLGTVAFAQVDRAVLEGTVSDSSGAAISGATVKTLAVDTGITQEQKTNANGYYRFPGLAVGRYSVTVTNTGFKTKAIEDVILQVGQTRTLDAALAVGVLYYGEGRGDGICSARGSQFGGSLNGN